jgi:hypothetical protein
MALLGAVANGCDESEADGSNLDAPSGGAAAEPGTGAPGCPPRVEQNYGCQGDAVWARDPQTGTCCQYDICREPPGWFVFSTESECQSSCRCAMVTGADHSMLETTVSYEVEYISLECGCAIESCDGCSADRCEAMLDAALVDWCAGKFQSALRGCGRVALISSGGFVGSSRVFDEATGQLLGTSWYSDVPHAPCQAYAVVAGSELSCPDAIECDPCVGDAGTSTPLLPACR